MPKYLKQLFDIIFETGYFPTCWTEGHIEPIYKKGPLGSVENYRGITLLSTLGKLFAKNDRLKGWAENYQVCIEAQAGFRANMGTSDNIVTLHGLFTYTRPKKKRRI